MISMGFLYTISAKNELFHKKFILHSEQRLTNSELTNLKKNPEAYAFLLQKLDTEETIINLNWKDLNLEILAPEKLPQTSNFNVNEIAIGNIQSLKPPAVVTRLEELLSAWPARVPLINLIWKLLLSPLIFMGHFIDKNRSKALQRLEDLDESFEYKNAQSYLRDYKNHLQILIHQLETCQESKSEEVKDYLQAMKKQASLLENGLKNPKNSLYELSRNLSEKASERLKDPKIDGETALMSLPVGFYQKNGKYQPMLATFYLDADKKLRLDLNCLGSPSFENLQQSYRFDNPTPELLTDLTHQLCVLSYPQNKVKSFQLGYREQIRIKVMHQFTKDENQTPATVHEILEKQFDAAKWLNESLCQNGGIPLKIPEEDYLDKSLKGIVGQDLLHFFPEAPTQDKVAFLIQLIEEHYERYFAAQPYLTEKQQARQLELLKFKVKKFEDHLIKRMDASEFEQLKTISKTFDVFFKKIQQLEAASLDIQKTRRRNKALEIDKGMIKSSSTYRLKANVNITKPSEEIVKKPQQVDVLAPYEVDLNELRAAVKTQDESAIARHLESLQVKADKLIEQKEYVAAKQLSVQTLKCLPLPEGEAANFWEKLSHSSSIHLNIVKFNKHIWECSLRLQEEAPEKDQILQMIKSQLIIAFCRDIDTDYREISDILTLHPHFRFGWLPIQMGEVNQILSLIKEKQNSSIRCDLRASTKKLKEFGAYDAMGILQCTLSCVMKPDNTLYPFFPKGRVSEALGVNYLDSLVKRAVEKGASTAKEKGILIKALKHEDNQERLKSMGRLELEPEQYVTHKYCVKITDRLSLLKGGLAYLPNGIWDLGQENFSDKYTFPNKETNSEALVGAARGVATYLTQKDDDNVQNKRGIFGTSLDVGTVSPQKGATEPTLLQRNLAKDPQGQINQANNYILESLQIGLDHKISFSSIFETLNLLRTHPYLLGEPEFQKTIFLNLTRPESLSQAIKANPLYFEILAKDIRELLQEKFSDRNAAPFLLLLSDTIKEHISYTQNSDIADLWLGFDQAISIGESSKTGYEWLHEWMIDYEKDRASTALTYMYASYKNPLDPQIASSDLALLLHAASIFRNTADSIGIPIFNKEINQWIQTQLLPFVRDYCEKNQTSSIALLNDWVRLSTNNPGYSNSNWNQTRSHLFINQDFKIDLNTLQIESKNPQYKFEGFLVDLPTFVAKSITQIFGLNPIRATLRRGASLSENHYDFEYNGNSFSIYYNQITSEIRIYQKLPVNANKPEGKKEWFQFVPQDAIENENLSSIERLIKKNGLWINTKETQQSYLFTHPLYENKKEPPYLVSLTSKGKIEEVKDTIANLYVVLDKDQRHCQSVPFANNQDTIFLASPTSHLIQEIRFLQDGNALKRHGRGNWTYKNERLGEGFRWLTDLSDDQLILRERSSAKAFLNSLGELHEKFVLPLTNGKSHVFMIHPYEIKTQKGVTKIEFDQTASVIKNLPPLLVTFDENGKQEGSPAAFLYLAYYFSHIKNYRLAEHYLEKAKKAAGSSETDKEALACMETLFEKIPSKSARSIAFQLKAQLALKSIKTHQISSTLFEPESAGEYLHNLQHIAKLHKLYLNQKDKLKEGALSEVELEEINRYVKMSMHNYVEKYQEQEMETAQTMDINFSQFEYFNHELSWDVNVLSLLLISDLDEKPSVDKLVERVHPDTDYILRNFFNFIIAGLHYKNTDGLSEEEQRIHEKELKKLQLFLSAPKSWELKPAKNPEELRHVQMVKFACDYLQIFLKSPTLISNEDFSPAAVYQRLKSLKSRLPYFDRSLGILTTVYDIQKNTLSHVESASSALKQILRDAILIRKKEDTKGSYDARKEGQHITSLNAVLKTLEDEEATSFLSPLEASMIPHLINDGNYDLDQPRELLTLLRDSEARNFSVLEMRNDSETLRLINQLEQKIKDRNLDEKQEMLSYDLTNVQEDFNKIREMLPSLKASGSDVDTAKRQLSQKAVEVKKYFQSNPEAKKTQVEENYQLQVGLELAEKKLLSEIEQKTTFSKEEIRELQKVVDKGLNHLKKVDFNERQTLLDQIKQLEIKDPKLNEALMHPEIYTEYDLFNEILRAYKDPIRSKDLGDLQSIITSYLFRHAAYLQFKKAKDLLKGQPTEDLAARALQIMHAALNEKRFQEAKVNDQVMRICLVGEFKEGIIYRPAQLETLQMIQENPNQWFSLIMGIGKTSYIMPTAAEILAKQGKLAVLTVPEILLSTNRQSFDRSTRSLSDLGGWEFSLPLSENLSFSLLAEKYAQLLQVMDEKNYVITSVEQLCSLHNLMIQLEEEKCKLLKAEPDENNEGPDEKMVMQIFNIEKKLHYLRKISQLLHDEAQDLNVERHLLGDEVDSTNDITHEVNLAVGQVVSPDKIVRETVRNIFEIILTSKKNSSLYPLKTALLADAQSVPKDEELESFMYECAKGLQKDPNFTKLLGSELTQIVSNIDADEWASYVTGKSSQCPSTLEWEDGSSKYIATAKQILSSTLKNLLKMKSGNEFGFSDSQGFLAVPKITKNETPGMRYGDEFEMITAQYLAYLEFLPCQSLNGSSENFIKEALKTYQNKYPAKYERLVADFVNFQTKKGNQEISLLDYLKTPRAWKHRFNLLDEIVFEGGYITRFNQQISTNVQEMYHGNMGGMTGTLDPYTLPFISHEVQFFKDKEKKISTRAVEAETLLRLTMNLSDGLDTHVQVYETQNALDHVQNRILKSPETKAFVNNIGDTSEGLDTLAWIEKIRQTPEGKKRSYLFPHPTFRVPYLWTKEAKEPLPYKNQQLPSDCICMYAPSDTRGIDLPIGKGDVHVFVGATTSTQELMQTLYRARQIGTAQKIVLHISQAWAKQIEPLDSANGITYGDIVAYIVSRTADNKESLNESAQIQKIKGKLKALVSKYLRQSNPKFNEVDFWAENNILNLAQYVSKEAEIFEKIRDLYIKLKEIHFESHFEPVEMISGIQKLNNTYEELEDSINELLLQLPEEVELEGKSNLREELEQLILDMREEKATLENWYREHERFLPEKTAKASTGSRNVKETVKELQLQKVVATQKEEQPEKISFSEEKRRKYSPLDFDKLFSSPQSPLPKLQPVPSFDELLSDFEDPIAPNQTSDAPIPLNSPFNELFISPEAQAVLEKYDTRRGDPLLYLIMTKDQNNLSRMTLVSKMDYHSVIFPALRTTKLEDKELFVFSLNMHGCSQIDGTSKYEEGHSDAFIAAKCFLGFKEYDKQEKEQLMNWIRSLNEDKKSHLLGYLKEHSTHSFYTFIDDLLQLKN